MALNRYKGSISKNVSQKHQQVEVVKVKYKESKETKQMREIFERMEKQALKGNKIYIDLSKAKKQQMAKISEREKLGLGEEYVDSDRSIAVGMGAEDIKSHILNYNEEKALGKMSDNDILSIHVLIEQTSHEIRQQKPHNALKFVNRALAKDPSCIDCLEYKGQCLIMMNKYREALGAANYLIEDLKEKRNTKALAVKAEALYNLGDFEHALVCFHKALKNSTTKERNFLLIGIKRTELAVKNAVGSTDVQYFRNLDKILNKLPLNIMAMPWYQLKHRVDGGSDKKGAKAMDRKFLSEMAMDKEYLESIIKQLNTEENQNAKKKSTRSIILEAEEALGFLVDRREFWSQQKPDYPADTEFEKQSGWETVMSRMIKKNSINLFNFQ